MTASDAVLLAPFIGAILVAVAILVVDFIWPGKSLPALLTTFVGLGLVALLTGVVGQQAAAEPGAASKRSAGATSSMR